MSEKAKGGETVHCLMCEALIEAMRSIADNYRARAAASVVRWPEMSEGCAKMAVIVDSIVSHATGATEHEAENKPLATAHECAMMRGDG